MYRAIGVGLAAALMTSGCGNFLAPIREEKAKTMDLTAKIRDFREGNSASPEGTHPHFNQGVASCEAHLWGVTTVRSDISTGGAADPAFPGDERTPVLASPDSLPAEVSRCFEPADRFGDWFEDRDSDVNRPFLYTMKFSGDEDAGIYRFREENFFPLDQGKGARKAASGGPEPFGHLQTGEKDGVDLTTHNYGFTLEMHAVFTYSRGKGQFLSLKGDDDVWAFINGKRVIDLGGIHAAESDSVNLDDRAGELGLEDQGSYPLDFFFAERSVVSSKLAIVTNLRLSEP